MPSVHHGGTAGDPPPLCRVTKLGDLQQAGVLNDERFTKLKIEILAN
jgi:hypothetical protein